MKIVMEMDFQNPNCSAICQTGNNYIELIKIYYLLLIKAKGTKLKVF